MIIAPGSCRRLAGVARTVPRHSRQVGILQAASVVRGEADISGMSEWLDSLKYNSDGLVAAIVQVRFFAA